MIRKSKEHHKNTVDKIFLIEIGPDKLNIFFCKENNHLQKLNRTLGIHEGFVL